MLTKFKYRKVIDLGSCVVYRHNIMNINSIDTFLNVKGGFNQGQRDVYFVRSLGSKSSIAKDILEIDKNMGKATLEKRLFYARVDSLPTFIGADDTIFYSQQYDKWKIRRVLSVRNNREAVFSKVLGAACSELVSQYKKIKPNVTDSIEKNFIVKSLFWVDSILGEGLKDWSERKCYKILADNVLKEQDYIFYYFLTLIGCDVLLMERTADITIGRDLKNLSIEIKEGQYNSVALPKFVPYEEEKVVEQPKEEYRPVAASTPKPEAASQRQEPVKVSIPSRPGRSAANITPPSQVQSESRLPVQQVPNFEQRTIVKTAPPQAPVNNEKSFEELALLASSIVMITVLNRFGEPESTGSGIMIGRDGYILTNNHVTEGGYIYAVQIEDDDRVYKADGVIKCNPTLDMAIIRINKKLKPLPIYKGKKKLVRGQKVVAIGSPLGLFNSVSDGIISGFREIKNVDMIQFTAPITHGSSGGAVLNMQGEVIGISTAGIDKGQNLNFAVGYENIAMFVKGFT